MNAQNLSSSMLSNNLFPTFGIDATRVSAKLYIGGYDSDTERYKRVGFSRIVRVAMEWPLVDFPLDDGHLDEKTLRTALRAAAEVSAGLFQGKRTLVTCTQGRNRSAFVAGLAMFQTYGMRGPAIVKHIQAAREPVKALTNDEFREYLLRL